MKFLEEGNFSGWLRITLYVVGLAVFVIGLGLDWLPRWLRMVAFLSGFGLMALGGISARAKMLKIKPFDNSYKKARDSYKVKDDEESK
ncbi:hypothetical protein V4C53_11555 [Paraburkholderia azotifigens]|uniref:hypothetical protein n=1 Tax=Paraburkholderia azotifigens TaxID=2057004 RepID=UPI0031742EDE